MLTVERNLIGTVFKRLLLKCVISALAPPPKRTDMHNYKTTIKIKTVTSHTCDILFDDVLEAFDLGHIETPSVVKINLKTESGCYHRGISGSFKLSVKLQNFEIYSLKEDTDYSGQRGRVEREIYNIMMRESGEIPVDAEFKFDADGTDKIGFMHWETTEWS